MNLPKHIEEKLDTISRQSNNLLYFMDKMETTLTLYHECKTIEDVYNNLNLRQVWRLVTHEPDLLDKEALGEKYDAIMEMYFEAKEKYS